MFRREASVDMISARDSLAHRHNGHSRSAGNLSTCGLQPRRHCRTARRKAMVVPQCVQPGVDVAFSTRRPLAHVRMPRLRVEACAWSIHVASIETGTAATDTHALQASAYGSKQCVPLHIGRYHNQATTSHARLVDCSCPPHLWCYTEIAPNAWQRRGTQKTRNTYNQHLWCC